MSRGSGVGVREPGMQETVGYRHRYAGNDKRRRTHSAEVEGACYRQRGSGVDAIIDADYSGPVLGCRGGNRLIARITCTGRHLVRYDPMAGTAAAIIGLYGYRIA